MIDTTDTIMEVSNNLNVIFTSVVTNKTVVINHNMDSGRMTSKKLHGLIATKEGIDSSLLKILINGKYVDTDSDQVVDDGEGTIFVTLSVGMVGGKGGFGSMLRAIGAQIEKTTNKEACRDLSGRRIRDVNIERRFQNWIAKAAERKKEQMKRKKERLERLRRVPNLEFKDEDYFKVRSEIPDKIDAALEYALKKSKNKSTSTVTSATVSSTSATVTSSSTTVTSETRQPSASTARETQKSESKPGNAPVAPKRRFLTKLGLSKKPRMWISEDLEVSDEEGNEERSEERTEERSEEGNEERSEERSGKNGNLNVGEEILQTGKTETMVQIHPEPEFLKADNRKTPVDVKETETSAKESETVAEESGTLAEESGTSAKESETVAEESGTSAKESETVAEESGTLAKESGTVAEEPDQKKTEPEPAKESVKGVEAEKVDLETFNSKEELVALGLDRLKSALLFLGMKCGGTLEQRADRLWSVRGLDVSEIPKDLLPSKNKK